MSEGAVHDDRMSEAIPLHASSEHLHSLRQALAVQLLLVDEYQQIHPECPVGQLGDMVDILSQLDIPDHLVSDPPRVHGSQGERPERSEFHSGYRLTGLHAVRQGKPGNPVAVRFRLVYAKECGLIGLEEVQMGNVVFGSQPFQHRSSVLQQLITVLSLPGDLEVRILLDGREDGIQLLGTFVPLHLDQVTGGSQPIGDFLMQAPALHPVGTESEHREQDGHGRSDGEQQALPRLAPSHLPVLDAQIHRIAWS